MIDYSFVRYLLAKKSVDDRALNQTVLAALRRELPRPNGQRRLQILEIGAGVGTMVSRLSDWDVVREADFTLVDQDLESLRAARAELERWGARSEPMADGGLRLGSGDAELRVRFVHADALALVVAPEHRQRYDLVMANAVLDVMDLRPALREIWQALAPGALFWFSINFDGETILLPEAPLDEQVMALYHRSMDERVRDGRPCGDSKTGRHLLELIPRAGKRLLAAGSSDWVVFPRDGAYENDEAYFLHHILHFMSTELGSHPELDGDAFAAWIRSRQEQIDRGQLIFIAHQLDVLGRA